MEKGVRLAVDTINSNGSLPGIKLELVIRDDRNDPQLAKAVTKDLILKEQVQVLIGPYSSECCLAITDVVNQYKTPLIVPVAMADKIITGSDYVFRNTLSVRNAQNKINEYVNVNKKEYTLLEGFNADSIGIMWQKDSWGKNMQKRVIKDMKALGKEKALAFNQSFDLGTSDFTGFFNAQKDNFPDVIYVISSGEEAMSIVSQGRALHYKGLFYGEGGFNYADFDVAMKEKADGCLFTSQWHPSFSTPMSDVFVQLYSKKYDSIPDMFAAISYEAVYILQNSLKRIKLSADNLNHALRKDLSIPKKLDGLSGTITFDENGQCDRPMFMLQKRWDGSSLQSFIVYPSQYAQGKFEWNFDHRSVP